MDLNEKINEMFKIAPDVEALINFEKYEFEFPFPTRDGIVNITMQLLWEGESIDVMKNSLNHFPPNDELGRFSWMKLETLVYAIKKIGSTDYWNANTKQNELLKNDLRIILKMSNDLLVDELWNIYVLICDARKKSFDSKLEESKKKILDSILNLKPL